MKVNFTYDHIQDIVQGINPDLCAAEAHGALSGMLCANADTPQEQWLTTLFGESWPAQQGSDFELFADFCEQTRQALAEVDFSFELFLPEDEALLSERASALGKWCQGFLYGLGAVMGDQQSRTGECNEVLSDLVEIAQLDADAAGEADEEAFMEISEFVRLGVQLIRGELQQKRETSRLH